MKTLVKNLLAISCLFTLTAHAHAQQTSTTAKLPMGNVEPYEMEVTYNKTSHLIFPSAIRYTDLGSDLLIAGKAEDSENVLRIKAAVRDFDEETNFSVITEDGRFYNFNVCYSSYPLSLNYDLLAMEKATDKANSNRVLFEDLGDDSPTLAGLLMETIYKKNKRIIKHIGSRHYGIRLLLKGIYTQNGKYYFHIEVRNKSNVPFVIDFVNFKVVDKKIGKRTVVQERPLTPLRTYRPLGSIHGKSTEQNVFLLDQFTTADDKVLVIEVYEKNGGRHQTMQVENADLVGARLIDDMHLKIK